MQNFNGTLIVETINGRYGPFNAAILKTSIGNFSVERKGLKELEEFSPGLYEGTFLIEEIFMGTYFTNGRSINELRVRINKMSISSDAEPLPAESQIVVQEVDPIEEEASTPAKDDSNMSMKPFLVDTPIKSKAKKSTAPATHLSQEESDATLFGSDWPLPDIYKIDMARDRAVIRQQANRLKALGFVPNPKDQTWQRQTS